MTDDVAAIAAAEAVNSLDWADVYKAARRRCLRDMTGSFYDEHLAREVADRVAKHIAHLLATRTSGERDR